MKVRFFILFALLALVLSASSDAPASGPDAIVENYLSATKRQAERGSSASMEVDISGSIPKLRKVGKLHALRHISRLGRITYEALKFQGDDTVKRNLIARYLQAEEQSQLDPAIAVTPDNYNFKFKGRTLLDARHVYHFEVSPKKKRQGLYRGEMWIDAQTFLRVQESGRLVKNPSMILRKVQFVRKYDIRDGVAVPRQLQSVADTWLVGKTELTVDYTNYSTDPKSAGSGDTENQ